MPGIIGWLPGAIRRIPALLMREVAADVAPRSCRSQGHELVIDPGQAQQVKRIFMLARDGLSIRSIAMKLDRDDSSRYWHRTTVERILKNDTTCEPNPGDWSIRACGTRHSVPSLGVIGGDSGARRIPRLSAEFTPRRTD